MPTYSAITSGQRAAGAPVDETVVGQVIDNPEAVFANGAGSSDIVGLDPISSVTASGGETYLSFTSGIDTTYDRYKIIGEPLLPGTDNVQLLCQISQSATFYTSANYVWISDVLNADLGTRTLASGTGATSMSITDSAGGNKVGNSSGEGAHLELDFLGPALTSIYPSIKGIIDYYQNTTDLRSARFAGWPTDAAGLGGTALDGIRFFWSSGTWVAGSKLTLYGLRT